jgi:hypothetical protein
VKKHHPINNSVGKDDASSSEGFGGGTRLQRLVPALKGLTGDTYGLRNRSTVGYAAHQTRAAAAQNPLYGIIRQRRYKSDTAERDDTVV